MKWAYHIKHKIKAATFLSGILVVILVSNLLNRNSFSNLDTAMSSVVADRLKPATYLYSISSNLYQKKELQSERALHSEREFNTLLKKHNDAIAVLVHEYDATVLTNDERQQWTIFKNNLAAYDALEHTTANAEMHNYFALCMTSLDKLNGIQVGEGNNLQKSSSSIVSNTMMLSSLELSLLIILGIFTLVLLSTSDNVLFKQPQNQALN